MSSATRLGPGWLSRSLIWLVVGGFLLLPIGATVLYTLRDKDSGGFTASHWSELFFSGNPSVMKPLLTGIGNSLVLAIVTVLLVLLLFLPTILLVNLRFPKLLPVFEFAALLPISIPAIVLVVGLAPIYLQIGRSLGTGAWTLAFAYGVTVLPFAYRSIQTSIQAVDLRTLSEASRTLGASWPATVMRVLAPNLFPGLLSASLISVAVVLGEFTIASLLNRQVLQTALVVVNRIDPYASSIFTLLSLLFCFLLLLAIGLTARARIRKTTA